MQTIRKINDELAVAEQIDLEQLPQLFQEGFQSILNLRSPDEPGFLVEEQLEAEQLGLKYVNLPMAIDAITVLSATSVFQQLDQLPKPVLIHCDSAIRSAAIVLMYLSTRRGSTLEQALNRATQLGLFNLQAR